MSEPLDLAKFRDWLKGRAYYEEWSDSDVEDLVEEIDRLRARLAEVEHVRDWMGANNNDAAYDLAIVALNRALSGEGDQPAARGRHIVNPVKSEVLTNGDTVTWTYEFESRWCPDCQKYRTVNSDDECHECGAWT